MATHRLSANKHRARSRDGAVMLVVLLILLVATASAAVSVANTQAELQASGNERIAVQTRYVAEAGLTTALNWAETASMTELLTNSVVPSMKHYAEPELRTVGLHMRHTMASVMKHPGNPALEVMPLSDAVPYTAAGGSGGAGAGGSGGSGGAPAVDDTTGSFGPHQTYGLGPGGFVVDFTDCITVTGANVGGMWQGEGETALTSYSCVLTARGRLEPLGGDGDPRIWKLSAGDKDMSLFSSAHDARAEAIITQ